MALLHAVHEARSRFSVFPEVQALTIDHGFRQESAGEARWVRSACSALGISHRTAVPEAPAPHSAIQDRASRARLDAFRQVVGLVLTAHTLDDDAETAVMRRQRGAGDHPGIAPLVWLHGTWLHRPLLSLRRTALRDWLATRRVAWIDDPSNANDRFERVRIRKALSVEPDMATRLANEARARSARRIKTGQEAAMIFESGKRATGGELSLPLRDSVSIQGPAFNLAIRAACGHVAAHENLPSASLISNALSTLSGAGTVASAARCVLRRSSTHVTVERERRQGAPTPLAPALHPWPSHVPSHDLALANAVYRAVGQLPIPDPPATIGRT